MFRARGVALPLLACAALAVGSVAPASGSVAASQTVRVGVTHGSWVSVGPMPHSRWNQITVRLHDERVLVAGGGDATVSGCKRSADLYSPVTNSWAPASRMHRARCFASAVVLRDGRVLVAGGADGSRVLRSAEIYHPVTNRWTYAAPMNDRRDGAIAELLPDGRVLVAGGYFTTSSTTAEVFNPKTNRWRRTDPMSKPRVFGSSARLPNGDILVAGDAFDSTTRLRTAERYVVKQHVWRPAGQFRGGQEPLLFRLPNGHLLAIAGGSAQTGVSRSVAEFNPVSNTWRPVAPLPAARGDMQVAALRGRPLVLGGLNRALQPTATGFLWRPGQRRWVLWTKMPKPSTNFGAVRLRNGSILVTGGLTQTSTASPTPTKYAFRYHPG